MSILIRSVEVCCKSLVVDVSPVLTTKSPPVALPVPMPACSVKSPPATSVPNPFVPLITALLGDTLVSPLPTTILEFFKTRLLLIVFVPAGISVSNAVTRSSVLTVNEVAFAVAPLTGHVPSKFATELEPILIVSPGLIPKVNGV